MDLRELPQIAMYMPDISREHPTVCIDEIEIDAGLADLIPELWRRGLRTSASCQGSLVEYHVSMGAHGHAYILFCEFEYGVEFLRALLGRIAHEQGIYRVQLALMDDRRAIVRFPPSMIGLIAAKMAAV
jgi:hypothetical protein